MVLFISALIIAFLDFYFKSYVVNNLKSGQELTTFIPFLKIVKVKNFGIAFGLFKNHNIVVVVLTLCIIAFFSFIIFKKKIRDASYTLAFSFMLIGAMGNLADRIFCGFVIDYLKLTFFPPVCNFSDYMICFGAAVLIFSYIKKSKAPEK